MTATPDSTASPETFQDLGLGEPLLKALTKLGYERPSPIQAATIPLLLQGVDLIGQAQTGTGKTAAFALPILNGLGNPSKHPVALVICPTRELAIQVAEAFQSYARFLKQFHVLPVYGGQDMQVQLRHLKRGVDVVVGTPGRLLDHLKRGTLDLSGLRTVVLDEADEMLRMGFIDDVEAILASAGGDQQTVLFSATLPEPIRRVAERFLKDPSLVRIAATTATVDAIDQRYWLLHKDQKLAALTRLLEVEETDGVMIFTRTRETTTELAEKISARGFLCAAINGDMSQSAREQTIRRLKNGQIDILVATDVAARGLDVDRISHVINYDIPHDTESYIHRIGRTGRAGRKGSAILLLTPREQRLLRAIEKATRQNIAPIQLPTAEDVMTQRVQRLSSGRRPCSPAWSPRSARNPGPAPARWPLPWRSCCRRTNRSRPAPSSSSRRWPNPPARARTGPSTRPGAPPRASRWTPTGSKWGANTPSRRKTSSAPSPMKSKSTAATSARFASSMTSAPSSCPAACRGTSSSFSSACACAGAP